MSIWTRIAEAISALAKGESLSQIFESLKTPPERSVAFTIAVIGLGAKFFYPTFQQRLSVVGQLLKLFEKIFHRLLFCLCRGREQEGGQNGGFVFHTPNIGNISRFSALLSEIQVNGYREVI